jgi:hypothetical protein
MNNYMKFSVILFILIASASCFAQEPCSAPESSQFDFWVGEWQLTWKDSSGQLMRGTNSIAKDLSGCVVHEHFTDYTDGFRGESVSAYDPQKKLWQQTWVDNKGNYMLFTGGMKDNVMDLRMERENAKGQNELFSMIWTNITPDSLDWTWRKSLDGGKKWQTLWKIHYIKQSLGQLMAPPPMVGQVPTQTGTIAAPTQPSIPVQSQPIEAVSPPSIPKPVGQ